MRESLKECNKYYVSDVVACSLQIILQIIVKHDIKSIIICKNNLYILNLLCTIADKTLNKRILTCQFFLKETI